MFTSVAKVRHRQRGGPGTYRQWDDTRRKVDSVLADIHCLQKEAKDQGVNSSIYFQVCTDVTKRKRHRDLGNRFFKIR